MTGRGGLTPAPVEMTGEGRAEAGAPVEMTGEGRADARPGRNAGRDSGIGGRAPGSGFKKFYLFLYFFLDDPISVSYIGSVNARNAPGAPRGRLSRPIPTADPRAGDVSRRAERGLPSPSLRLRSGQAVSTEAAPIVISTEAQRAEKSGQRRAPVERRSLWRRHCFPGSARQIPPLRLRSGQATTPRPGAGAPVGMTGKDARAVQVGKAGQPVVFPACSSKTNSERMCRTMRTIILCLRILRPDRHGVPDRRRPRKRCGARRCPECRSAAAGLSGVFFRKTDRSVQVREPGQPPVFPAYFRNLILNDRTKTQDFCSFFPVFAAASPWPGRHNRGGRAVPGRGPPAARAPTAGAPTARSPTADAGGRAPGRR